MRDVLPALATGLVLLAGCGAASTPDAELAPGSSPYAGPMSAPVDYRDNATVMERSGAAGLALECDGAPYQGGGGDYDSGLESVQGSPEDALENWLDNEAWAYQLPETGYEAERDAGDRVLLSYDVESRTKIAVITADDMRDYNDDEGWGVEAWGQCDPAELPANVTDALGIGVWEDEGGARVPVTRVRSFQGAEHCGWEDITFVLVGPERGGEQYVRDPRGELTDYLRTTYDDSARLPEDATDTGWRRDGRQLWLDPRGDAAYLVSRTDPDDVERWPASKEPIGCA